MRRPSAFRESRLTTSGERARSSVGLLVAFGALAVRTLWAAYPDRDPMLAKEGVVHTTKTYTLRDFADAEWESEEKSRHVKELQKDVDEASARAGGG